MKIFWNATVAAVALAGTATMGADPAAAQFGININIPGVHIGVNVPAYFYGPGYYPPGPCDAYNQYYAGDCGYSVYTGPVYFDGVAVDGPHYYRWYGDHPVFWYRGGWHDWDGWHDVSFGWDHGEGYGWHDGHWDRDWGRAHWSAGGEGHDHGDFHSDREHGAMTGPTGMPGKPNGMSASSTSNSHGGTKDDSSKSDKHKKDSDENPHP